MTLYIDLYVRILHGAKEYGVDLIADGDAANSSVLVCIS